MKAVIIAGGKGTRLGALTKDIPKPLIEIGGVPVIEHQVRLLKRYGIEDVIVTIGHLGEKIEARLGDGSALGVRLSYFREDKPLGTAGAFKELETELTEDFLVLFGDVMLDMSLARFIAFHQRARSECTIAVHPNDHPADSDLVEIDGEGRVTAIHPKPHDPAAYYHNLVNAGACIMSPAVLSLIGRGESHFGQDVFPALLGKLRFFGYRTAEYLRDMGTPDRLADVNRDWASGRIERLNSDHLRKAIFLDRDGVLNADAGLVCRVEDLELLPGAAEAVRAINESEYLAIVVTNQSVIARNLSSLEELDAIHKKLETELGKAHAHLDALYYCPHHPDAGYPEERIEYKIACDCRKPAAGMLYQAAQEFAIDLGASFLIGDSGTDIQAARAVGATPVGVHAGDAFKDADHAPERSFATLGEAVRFILSTEAASRHARP